MGGTQVQCFKCREIIPSDFLAFGDQGDCICSECVDRLERVDLSSFFPKDSEETKERCEHYEEEFKSKGLHLNLIESCKIHEFCQKCLSLRFKRKIKIQTNDSNCFYCIRKLLFECHGCCKIINRKDKKYPITCKSHFYCDLCTETREYLKHDCLSCKKMNHFNYKAKLFDRFINSKKFSYLNHLMRKPLDLKFIFHGNHNLYLCAVFVNFDNLINCGKCREIITALRYILKINVDDNKRKNKYSMIIDGIKKEIEDRNRRDLIISSESTIKKNKVTNDMSFSSACLDRKGCFSHHIIQNEISGFNLGNYFYTENFEYLEEKSSIDSEIDSHKNIQSSIPSKSCRFKINSKKIILDDINEEIQNSLSIKNLSPKFIQSAVLDSDFITPQSTTFLQAKSQINFTQTNFPQYAFETASIPLNTEFNQIESTSNTNPGQVILNSDSSLCFNIKKSNKMIDIDNTKVIKHNINSLPFEDTFLDIKLLQKSSVFNNENEEFDYEVKNFSCFIEKYNKNIESKNVSCRAHNEQILELKCKHKICIKGVEEILLNKVEKICDLIKERNVDELNKVEFCIGCTENCFVRNLFCVDVFYEKLWKFWGEAKLSKDLFFCVYGLFSGVLLKFEICECGCNKMMLGKHK